MYGCFLKWFCFYYKIDIKVSAKGIDPVRAADRIDFKVKERWVTSFSLSLQPNMFISIYLFEQSLRRRSFLHETSVVAMVLILTPVTLKWIRVGFLFCLHHVHVCEIIFTVYSYFTDQCSVFGNATRWIILPSVFQGETVWPIKVGEACGSVQEKKNTSLLAEFQLTASASESRCYACGPTGAPGKSRTTSFQKCLKMSSYASCIHYWGCTLCVLVRSGEYKSNCKKASQDTF